MDIIYVDKFRYEILKQREVQVLFTGVCRPISSTPTASSQVKFIVQYNLCEISSPHGGEYEVKICLLGCTAV
jgi:hypothetical protein